jgi:hypothetical protein
MEPARPEEAEQESEVQAEAAAVPAEWEEHVPVPVRVEDVSARNAEQEHHIRRGCPAIR